MTTVVDTLVLELGLDPSKFTEGQREALAAFKKTQEEVEKGGKNVDAQSSKIENFFGTLKRQALGLTAAFMGGRGIQQFAEYVTHIDANVGRLAYTTQQSTREISAWQGVARQFGGTAETVSGSMQGLTDQVSQFLLTGQTGGFLQVFNALGVSLYDSNRQLKTAGQLFLDLNDAIQGMNPSRARSLLLAAGADPATVNMLLTNSKTLKDMLETQRQIGGTTDQSAEAAGKLQAAWQRIYTRVEEFGRKFLPMMLVFSGLAEFAMDWLANKISGRPMTPPPSGAGVPGGVSSSGAMNNAQIEAAIRSEARARGIDPDIAVRVWQSEGKGGYVGDRGSSFGPFQLHYGGVASGGMAAKGLGDKFTATTGLDARDPSTTLAQIRFSLDEAARGGWGPWHGWTGLPRAGLAGAHPMGGDTNTSHSTTNVNIGKVEVVTQATDGDRAARDFASTLERMKFGASANYGQR